MMAQLHVARKKSGTLDHACIVEPAVEREEIEISPEVEPLGIPAVVVVLEPGDWMCRLCGSRGHEFTQGEQLEQILAPEGDDHLEALAATEDHLFGGVKWSRIRSSLNAGDGAVWKDAWKAGTSWDRAAVEAWIRAKSDDEVLAGIRVGDLKRALR
jgi:hypothetical protein